MIRFASIFSLALSFALFSTASAQQISVSAKVDTNLVTIGDWINLSLRVERSDSVRGDWSPIGDKLGHFEVLRKGELQTKKSDDRVVETTAYVLSTYDSGYYQIPAIVFSYTVGNDTAKRFASTLPIDILVQTVAVDVSQEIKDVKPPLGIPIGILEILLYAGIILAVAAGGFGIHYYLRRRKDKWLLSAELQRPPHEIALMELRRLEERKLWQRGFVKQYHSEVTEIIRRYIERRFGVMALEMTTGEVMHNVKQTAMSVEVQETLFKFLSDADLVKFAKYQPTPEENETELEMAHDIVQGTKPVVEPSISNDKTEVMVEDAQSRN